MLDRRIYRHSDDGFNANGKNKLIIYFPSEAFNARVTVCFVIVAVDFAVIVFCFCNARDAIHERGGFVLFKYIYIVKLTEFMCM